MNYDKIDFTKHLAYYECGLIANSEDTYKKAGDDCVRFFFSVMNCADGRFTDLLANYSKKGWTEINSKKMNEDIENLVFAMKQLGYIIYDTTYFYSDINGDKLVDVESTKIDKNFQLKKGDILSRNGHIHFYLNNEKDNFADDFGWGKVNRVFPQKSEKYSIVEQKDGFGIKFRNQIYTRVYRYIGNNEEINYED